MGGFCIVQELTASLNNTHTLTFKVLKTYMPKQPGYFSFSMPVCAPADTMRRISHTFEVNNFK
jgi:hypothetical protein